MRSVNKYPGALVTSLKAQCTRWGPPCPASRNNVTVGGTQDYSTDNKKVKTAAKYVLQALKRWERRTGKKRG